jgi:hypothetical protein
MPGFSYVVVFYEDINMTNIQNTIKCVALIVVLVALSGIMLLGFPKTVSAQRHGGGSQSSYSRGGGSYQPSYSRGGGSYQPSYSHGGGRQVVVPSYSHGGGRYYPNYSYRGGRYYPNYSHGGSRYYPYHSYRGWGYYPHYYYGGWGYYSWWPWFSVVASLPLYYQTLWIGGYPYYYANGTYYAPAAGGYAIVDPPQEAVSNVPPPAASAPSEDKLFIYPRKGQSEQQQAEDRYQCHRWAVDQTGYDPTRVSGGVPSVQKRGDYQRAMVACLDARGYSAK